MSQEAVEVAGPPKREKTVPVGFRCPAHVFEWLRRMAPEGGDVKLTDAVVWALEIAKDVVDTGGDFLARLERVAVIQEISRGEALRRALDVGLPQLERMKPAAKK